MQSLSDVKEFEQGPVELDRGPLQMPPRSGRHGVQGAQHIAQCCFGSRCESLLESAARSASAAICTRRADAATSSTRVPHLLTSVPRGQTVSRAVAATACTATGRSAPRRHAQGRPAAHRRARWWSMARPSPADRRPQRPHQSRPRRRTWPSPNTRTAQSDPARHGRTPRGAHRIDHRRARQRDRQPVPRSVGEGRQPGEPRPAISSAVIRQQERSRRVKGRYQQPHHCPDQQRAPANTTTTWRAIQRSCRRRPEAR